MKKTDWKQMWKEDVNSMLATMCENMACDLRYGYDARGKSMQEYHKQITRYMYWIQDSMNAMEKMEEEKAQKWAYADLKRRGAIA